MKRVLITGGAGFIAHHLIYYLLKNTNWEIVSLDRLDYSGNLNRLDDIMSSLEEIDKKRLKIVFHDLKSEINPWIKKEIGYINVILHLAAGSHVDRSIDYPLEFVMDNVVGTANILEYARMINNSNNLERFIYFSTDEIFGPAPNGIDYKENDRYNSTNPYSATKAGGEELAVAYENTYGLPVYITHTMNVFGERQHPEKFIPMCIKRIRDSEIVTIHSDKSKKIPGSRHYIHAEDVSEAIHFLLTNSIIFLFLLAERYCRFVLKALNDSAITDLVAVITIFFERISRSIICSYKISIFKIFTVSCRVIAFFRNILKFEIKIIYY